MKTKHKAKPVLSVVEGWEALIVLAIFVLALFPRILDLDVFITPDELKWTCRSINFRAGLTQGDFARAYQTGHPGVITMWLGTLSMPPDPTGKWQTICQETNITRIMQATPPGTLTEMTEYLFAARRGVAILTAASAVIVYLMVRQLLDRRTALITAILIALDPFYLALSRVLHLDAIITALMTISLLSLLLYLKHQRPWPYLALSGAAAALAALNKAPALFLAPFAGLTLVAFGRYSGKSLLEIGQAFLLWALVAGLIGFVLWPALWVDPLGAITGVLGTSVDYAERPHSNLNFFWGQMRPDPGPWFYPVAWAFRTTPLVVLGLILSAILLIKNDQGQRATLVTLLAYGLLFAGFMTIGQKKFDRYILPIFPALNIVAAAGLNRLVETMNRRINRVNFYSIAVVLVLLLSAGLTLPYHPYYFPYYNPLVGGSTQAPHTLLVGWGEGLEKAANYLNQKKDAGELHVALRYTADFAPFFVGRTIHTESYDPATTDYVVIYVNQVQRDLNPEIIDRYYESQEPEYTVSLHGIDYAWVYPNLNYRAPMEYIASYAEADEASPEQCPELVEGRSRRDVILVSTPSLFAKHYDGDLPLYVMGRGWSEGGIVTELQKILGERRRLWYVKYLEEDPNPTLELIDYQLATHLFKVEEHAFPDIVLGRYQTFASPSFETSATQSPLDLNFEGELRLRGYGLVDKVAQWGKDLGIVFEWEALRDLNRYYAAFIHLVDEQGHTWGQGDKWLMNEALIPTAGWQGGEVVLDRYSVSLVKGTPPGRYSLRIGLYDRVSRGRLEIRDSEGVLLGDSYELGTIEVKNSPLMLSPEDLEIGHPLEWNLTGQLKLLGYDLDEEEVAFGEEFTLTLYWQALREMEEDYNLVVQLRGENRVWAEGRYVLGSEYYPTSQWREGEALWNRHELEVDPEAPFVEGTLEIDLLDAEGRSLLGEALALTEMGIQGRRFEAPLIQHPMEVDLAGKMALLGYDLEAEEIKAGDTVHLTLYWRAQGEMDISYTVFTQLLGKDDKLWGQKDGIPMQGRHPTTQWKEGEVIVDEYDIAPKEGIPTGRYRLGVGMYDLETRDRLPAFDKQGTRLPQDWIVLGEVRVED